MPDQDPVSPDVDSGGDEEQDEPRTPKQKTAWAKLQSERDAAQREAQAARAATSAMQSLQQQNADLQNRLRNIELQQRTAGLPQEQAQLAVIQSQLEDAIRQNQSLQQASATQRSEWERTLGPMAVRQVALGFVEDYDLPTKIDTPIGMEKTSDFLMKNARDPAEMEAIAKKIAANIKKGSSATAGAAKAAPARYLGSGGAAGGSGRTKTVGELTSAEFARVRELKTREGLTHEQAMAAVSRG